MKAKHLVKMFVASVIAMFSGCINEEQIAGPDQLPAEKTQSYAKIRVVTPTDNGTRTEESFLDGTVSESVIKDILFVFYDASGSKIGLGTEYQLEGKESDETPNVQNRYIVQIEMDGPAENAETLMAYINLDETTKETLKSSSLSDALNTLYDVNGTNYSTSIDGTNCFIMTNSGYYDATTGAYTVATPITGQIYRTFEEAANAGWTKIYVERVAAKVQLVMTSQSSDPGYEMDEENQPENYKLTFVPTGWDMTAKSKKTMLMKYLPSTFAEVEAEEGYPEDFWEWANAYYNHRSYWAYSYGYSATVPAAATLTFPTVGSDNNTDNYLLDYVKYSDIATATIPSAPDNEAGWKYVLENTFPATRLTEAVATPYAAATSVVIAGYYKIDGEGSSKFDNGFYRRKKIDNSGNVQYSIYTQDEVIAAMAGGVKDLFASSAEGTPLTDESLSSYFELTHVDYYASMPGVEDSKAADNDYVLCLKSGSYGNLYYRQNAQWLKIVNKDEASAGTDEISFKTVNELLEINAGLTKFYKKKLAYFYIPIRHYNDDDATLEEVFLAEPQTGNYGVVRNHAYRLTIDAVAGWGNGVDDEDNIPLPDPNPEESYFINAELNVLAWHLIDYKVSL